MMLDRTEPLKGVRKMIAGKLHGSLRDMAQLSFHTSADATALVAVREQLKAAGKPVGYEDLIILALRETLREFPLFNATQEADTATIRGAINISVAIAVEQGLMAPTIFNVETLTLQEINEKRKDVVERAKAGKLTVPEMTGGTFTISNLGFTVVDVFTPIINPPQMAILGLGRIKNAPYVNEDGELSVRPEVGLSITVDHRFIDGEPAGRFLSDLCERLSALTA